MTTSDRIAVMNGGRIEQIDDPMTLYTRPKTRYVAEFIGRSNILDGKRNGGERVAFKGFEIPLSRLQGEGGLKTELFSLRTQSPTLHDAAPPARDAVVLSGSIVDRAFLGETWDYAFQVENTDLRLRVLSPPRSVYTIGQKAWVEIDPAQIVPIQ